MTADLVGDGDLADVVGVAESTESRPSGGGRVRSGASAEPREDAGPTWLGPAGRCAGPGPGAQRAGAPVLSRAVVIDPPPRPRSPTEIRAWTAAPTTPWSRSIVLIVVMALIEVVLLAGPAFAVAARRQSRTLALMAATGGTPPRPPRGARRRRGARRPARCSVSCSASWSAWLAAAGRPALVRPRGSGPSTCRGCTWSALRSSGCSARCSRRSCPPGSRPARTSWRCWPGVVPTAAVAALADPRPGAAGRRGRGSAYGATRARGEFLIAGSAILAVLGMILLVPMVVVGVARLAGRLPLSLRYAARDAARHRTRTVPAVAAVAATVAGVVALGIGVTSDEAENVGTYQAAAADGHGPVTAYDDDGPSTGRRSGPPPSGSCPDATVTGCTASPRAAARATRRTTSTSAPPDAGPAARQLRRAWGSSTLVGATGAGPAGRARRPTTGRGRGDARRRRARGFTDRGVEADEVELAHRWNRRRPRRRSRGRRCRRSSSRSHGTGGPQAVLPSAAADEARGAGRHRRAQRHRRRSRRTSSRPTREALTGVDATPRSTSSAATRPTTRP